MVVMMLVYKRQSRGIVSQQISRRRGSPPYALIIANLLIIITISIVFALIFHKNYFTYHTLISSPTFLSSSPSSLFYTPPFWNLVLTFYRNDFRCDNIFCYVAYDGKSYQNFRSLPSYLGMFIFRSRHCVTQQLLIDVAKTLKLDLPGDTFPTMGDVK